MKWLPEISKYLYFLSVGYCNNRWSKINFKVHDVIMSLSRTLKIHDIGCFRNMMLKLRQLIEYCMRKFSIKRLRRKCVPEPSTTHLLNLVSFQRLFNKLFCGLDFLKEDYQNYSKLKFLPFVLESSLFLQIALGMIKKWTETSDLFSVCQTCSQILLYEKSTTWPILML